MAVTLGVGSEPLVGVMNSSFSVLNTGDAPAPVTITVYVPFAANDGEKPVRLVVVPAVRTASCGFESFTSVH